MHKLALAALQAPFHLAQRMSARKLAEQHRHKLAPARQPLGSVLSPGLLDQALEFNARNQLENLAEHAA